MKLQLKRIDPITAGKVLGLFYAGLALLVVPFFLVMGLFATFAGQASMTMTSQGSAPVLPGAGVFAGMGLLMALMLPVFYGVMGFIFGALAALVYNLICRWVGGLVLDFEVVGAPASPAVTAAPLVMPPDLPRA